LRRVVHKLRQLTHVQLDITDDNFLSLMSDDGSTKDDVKMPEGEVGDKIEKLFRTDEKDTSEYFSVLWHDGH
jgi:hypothetical protein